MTETTTTPFPERMHWKAVETSTRCATDALATLAADVEALRKTLAGHGTVFGSDARKLAEQAMRVSEHLSALEVLRDVREWDEAERNG